MLENVGTTNSLTNTLTYGAAEFPAFARGDAGDAWGDYTGVAWIWSDPADYPAPEATQEIHTPWLTSINNLRPDLGVLTRSG